MISKRNLRFLQMTPLLAVCEYCNPQFSGSEEDVASAKIPIKMPCILSGLLAARLLNPRNSSRKNSVCRSCIFEQRRLPRRRISQCPA